MVTLALTLIFQTCGSIATDSLMLLFIQYKCACLTLSLSRCITCHDVCVQQSHATKRLLPYHEVNFENLLPCYCYAMKTTSKTIRAQLSQPASAGKGVDMSVPRVYTTGGGLGLKPASWALYFTKNLLPAQRRLITFAYFLLVNLST